MGVQVIGIDPGEVSLAATTPRFRPGTVAGLDLADGYKEYVYGRAVGAVTGPGFLCGESTGFAFQMLTTANTAGGASQPVGRGSRVGGATSVMADGQFGWFQIYGRGPARVLASAAKATRLNTTATPGAADDDGTAGARTIEGLTLGTAAGGAAETVADALYTYPNIGATI